MNLELKRNPILLSIILVIAFLIMPHESAELYPLLIVAGIITTIITPKKDTTNIIIYILIGFILGSLIACILNIIYLYYFLSPVFAITAVQMIIPTIITDTICGLLGGLIGYNILKLLK